MLEHMAETAVWDRPEPVDGTVSHYYTVPELVALGADQDLAERLKAWAADWSLHVLRRADGAESLAPGELEAVHRQGQQLALELQNQLWDIEVRYWHHERPDLPVREQRTI
ncbi:hypothetical protein SAMN06264364_1201 [Quadrisphaera granulorum]|uniref:Uncharacterized protein n=1 Tax=Quadrisphaera granulorum TaxID=317664 RepID=A0A316A2A5_9ACTN|nr:hypothetical protein [Quadrisphaera granulorum]PWJ51723.1 hypothetical protein BXY45_1201 [Quadrisphaera granulorum]SZE97670.1 hypothetical protein SAMN06264364_1201 [Quadrisphaera granulorum]